MCSCSPKKTLKLLKHTFISFLSLGARINTNCCCLGIGLANKTLLSQVISSLYQFCPLKVEEEQAARSATVKTEVNQRHSTNEEDEGVVKDEEERGRDEAGQESEKG